MSSFPGYFPSLPGIRCDRFTETRLGPQLEGAGGTVSDQERTNWRGEQFFLSHCHEDHMMGLRHLGHYLDLHWGEGEADRQGSSLQRSERSMCSDWFMLLTSALFM